MIIVFDIIRILQFVTTILWKEIPVPMPNEEKKLRWIFILIQVSEIPQDGKV